MADKPVFVTPEGLARLKSELEFLVMVRRPQVAERIQQAKEFANTIDNAEYDDAKNEQSFVEGKIQRLEAQLASAVLIREDSTNHDEVRIGSAVVVVNPDGEQERYLIVGSTEANPRAGKISNESPVGRALLGHHPGDEVQVMVPAGVLRYTILQIE